MSDFPRRVAARFDRAAATYDAHSAVQRHAAARLAGLIATASLPPRPRVLEIGCGTGHLTGLLVRHLPGARLFATDLAPAMVAACRQRLGDRANVAFAVMDGRRPASADFYDLICANLVAQWFTDLPAVLATLSHRLAPGGLLALNLLGEETFREWRDAHARCGLQAGTPPLCNASQLPAHFPANGRLHLSTEHWLDRPASGLDFLRSLRAIGADTPQPGHTPIPAARLKRVLLEFGLTPVARYELIHALWRSK